MWTTQLLALASAFSGTFAAPFETKHAPHETRALSRDWRKLDRVLGDVMLPMRIGLTQSNLDRGHDLLMEVSHPDSDNFGQYYSAEEIHDLFAPAQSAVDAVREWLESAGIGADRVSQSVNKQWLQFDAKTSEAESLLKSKYHFFEHTPSGKASIATDEYFVPLHLTQHIDYITPGIKLYNTRSVRPKPSEIQKRSWLNPGNDVVSPLLLSPPPIIESLLEKVGNLLGVTCDVAITPDCIATMYNITKATKATPGNELGIFEDLGDYYAQEDLDLFFATLTNIPVGTKPTLKGVDGGTAPATLANAGPESDLDFQISYPIIYPQNSILFQTDDPVYEANYTYEGFLNNFLDAIDGSYCSFTAFNESSPSPLDPPYPDPAAGGYKGQLQCGVYKPTNVISVSYGGQEADLSVNYQKRQCAEFMKLGMQGVSVLISSGDSGVAGPAGDDSANGCLGGGKIFSPDFPASCPYITAVGATLLTGSAQKDEETAVTRFPSGGGFSNIYPIADYQRSAVSTYLTKYTPPYLSYATTNNVSVGSNGGIYNRGGRGYPDVSAVGDNVIIYNKGAPTLIGGTSASAPVFAAIITRINEERLAVGKKPVGFLNPTLYSHPEVLHDITVGSNPGCGTDGFSVAPGWDPVTGLGTPNYPALLKLYLSLK